MVHPAIIISDTARREDKLILLYSFAVKEKQLCAEFDLTTPLNVTKITNPVEGFRRPRAHAFAAFGRGLPRIVLTTPPERLRKKRFHKIALDMLCALLVSIRPRKAEIL